MTQKHLGTLVGFPEKTADIRMAQYEAGTRTPKEDLTKALAAALDVYPLALNVPDIDSHFGIMHPLFALEDRYGLVVEIRDGELLFRIDPRRGKRQPSFLSRFPHGQPLRRSTMPARSAKMNTTNGAIITPSTMTHKSPQKYPRRS